MSVACVGLTDRSLGCAVYSFNHSMSLSAQYINCYIGLRNIVRGEKPNDSLMGIDTRQTGNQVDVYTTRRTLGRLFDESAIIIDSYQLLNTLHCVF